jgi:hypothetical protein
MVSNASERAGGPTRRISTLVPSLTGDLLSGQSLALFQRVGMDVIRQVILDVLCGRNLRDSTEMLTRRRVAMLNAATLVVFLRGSAVDRLGRTSRVEELAQSISGTIVQMSMSFWPQLLAAEMARQVGYEHELATIDADHIEDYLRRGLADVPIEDFLADTPVGTRR